MEIEPGYTLGVVACGTMGTAVLNAAIENAFNCASDIHPGAFVASVNTERSAERLIKSYGSRVSIHVRDNESVVRESHIILLGCKPYMAESILTSIPGSAFDNKVVISLLAGKTIEDLEEMIGSNSVIVARAMTNTPAKIGHGMTVVSLPSNVELPDTARAAIDWLFNQTGRCLFLDEKQQDAATALCGSGPAFMYLVMEALCDGAVRMGMPYAIAKECAAQVLVGAGQMALETGVHPAVLKSQVCTPGGTTIGGLLKMEDSGVRSAVARAVEEATNIAKDLSKN